MESALAFGRVTVRGRFDTFGILAFGSRRPPQSIPKADVHEYREMNGRNFPIFGRSFAPWPADGV
jgi:hypothetical protein